MASTVPASGLLLLAGGAVLAYSGLKGKGVANSIRALLAGQSPATALQTTGITAGDSSTVPTVAGVVGGTGTQSSFFSGVLQGLGAPVSQANLSALAGVNYTEGVNSYNNPFNIEWHPGDNPAWQGVGNWNSVGVQEYASPAQGIAATVAFLQNNSRWSTLVSALQASNQQLAQSALSTIYASWGAAFRPAPANQVPSLLNATG